MNNNAMPQVRITLSMLHAESLLSMVEAAGGALPLHKPAMRQLKRKGLNRSDIDAAIDRLVKDGTINAIGTSEGVVLMLVKAETPASEE